MTASAGSSQLLAFIKFLRGRNIPVSPADTLDAVQAASLLGYEDRTTLRDGLAAVLAKSSMEELTYREAFDVFFAPPDNRTDPEARGGETQPAPEPTDGPTPDGAENGDGAAGQSLDDMLSAAASQLDPTLTDLKNSSLLQALQSGDESTLALAIESAASEARVDEIRMFTQRGQFTRRLLDALGEAALRDAAIALEKTQPRAFDEIQAMREYLRQRARDRVERSYLVHAAGDTEDFLDSALAEVRLANISPHQMARMRKLIDRMARKLASRHGRRRRRTRRGQLNVPATLRASIATDGVPFTTRWRQIKKKKPQVMAICDVSGSVAAYAKFLLMFLYAVQDVLPRTRSFAFSSALGEVTEWFDSYPVEEAITRVNRAYGGATDYARALEDFGSLALQDINIGKSNFTDDEIDEIIIPGVAKFGDHDFKSVNRSNAGDELKKDGDEPDDETIEKEVKPFIKKVKKVLGERVKDVKVSSRLTDSPSVLVADTDDPTFQMQEMMRAMGQMGDMPEAKPILEINLDHPILKKMKGMRKSKDFDNATELLYEQAMLLEGMKLENPADFVKRLNEVLTKSL